MADKIITLDELLKMLDKYNHKELHVHHTWRPDHSTYFNRPDPLYWQAAMRRYHKETNGWSDIGQHVTLLPDGRFVTGRDFSRDPASIKGYNTKAFAVEMIGDFDIGKDVLQGPQRESIIGLARWYHSQNKYIRFHRENADKTCPGTGIDKRLFMAEVEEKRLALQKGMKSEEVRQLQLDLIKLGYGKHMEPYGADGSFGAATERALMAWQHDNGLKVDGRYGPASKAKMAELLANKSTEDPKVKELQAKVTKLEAQLAKAKDLAKQIGEV